MKMEACDILEEAATESGILDFVNKDGEKSISVSTYQLSVDLSAFYTLRNHSKCILQHDMLPQATSFIEWEGCFSRIKPKVSAIE